MYALGDEVAIDNTRAYEWYERAAQLGHEQSQLIVASVMILALMLQKIRY